MYKKLIFSILLAGVSSVAGAKVEWLNDVHDFGAFSEDNGDAECRFAMVNLGPEPIALTSVRASCGCTTPSYSREAVIPGDTAYVNVKYNPIGRPGRFEKKVYVDTSDKSIGRTTLVIKGTVIGSARTMEARFPVDAGVAKLSNSRVAFGNVPKTGAKSAYLKIYNTTFDTITPRWEGVPDYLRIVSNDSFIAPGQQATYVFTSIGSAAKDYGLVNDTVSFFGDTDAEAFPVEVISMFVEDFSNLSSAQRMKGPKVEVDRQTVDFGEFDASRPATSTLLIGNSGHDRLEIRRVYSSDPGVAVGIDKLSVKNGQTAKAVITVNPAQLPDKLLNGRLVIITNDPDNPVISLRLTGQAVE